MDEIYDLVIIGAGPAGLAASLYAARYKLNHLILGTQPGGQMSEIKFLENYPGFISISGTEFVGRMVEQLGNLGVQIQPESVSQIKKLEDGTFQIETPRNKYRARTMILAMGAEYRRINIPGEKEFTGRGVSYCATCDALFFKDKAVAVIGGANSAAVVALELTDFASKVFLIFRRDKMTADPIWVEKIDKHEKIEKISGTNVLEIKGDMKVEKITLDKPYQDKTSLHLDGVFIEIGSDPGVTLAQDLGVMTDPDNFIVVNPDQTTNVPGIYAAGDITTGSNKFRQILTGAAEGSIAASSIYKTLKLK